MKTYEIGISTDQGEDFNQVMKEQLTAKISRISTLAQSEMLAKLVGGSVVESCSKKNEECDCEDPENCDCEETNESQDNKFKTIENHLKGKNKGFEAKTDAQDDLVSDYVDYLTSNGYKKTKCDKEYCFALTKGSDTIYLNIRYGKGFQALSKSPF